MLSVLQKDYNCGFIEAGGRAVHPKEEKLMVGDRQLTCQASGCPLNDAIDREYHPNAHSLLQAWRLHSLNESVTVRDMLIRAFLQRQLLINCDTSKSIIYSLRDPYPASALSLGELGRDSHIEWPIEQC